MPVRVKWPHAKIVKFDGCLLPGRHIYGYDNNSFSYRRKLLYDSCRLLDWEAIDEFILSAIQEGTPSEGNKAPVKFRDCIPSTGGGGYKLNINGTANGNISTGTDPELKSVRFKTSQGVLVQSSGGGTATLEAFLPKGAVIVGVRSKKGSVGSKTNKNWVYKLLDLSNSEAVIAKIEGGGTIEWKTGWSFEEKLNLHITGSGSRWGLKLVCENVEEAAQASWFEVDYLA